MQKTGINDTSFVVSLEVDAVGTNRYKRHKMTVATVAIISNTFNTFRIRCLFFRYFSILIDSYGQIIT